MIRVRLRIFLVQAAKLIGLVGTPFYWRGLFFGVAASIDLKPVLPTGDLATVVDCGANRGQFSLLIRAHYPLATIHAFEPVAESADRYARLFAGDEACHLHRCALGAEPARSEMFVPDELDNASLLPISPHLSERVPHTDKTRRITVAVERLDRILDPAAIRAPALLKLDVQGAELAVLAGAEAILDCFDYVLTEVSFLPFYAGQPLADAMITALSRYGFELAAMGTAWRDRDGRVLQTDLLFARRT